MQVYLENSLEAIGQEQWDALASESPTNTIFQAYGWHLAWWKTFKKDLKFFLICVKEGERLTGIAPLYISPKGRWRVVKFIGTGHSDCCDFLYPPGHSEILEDFFDYLIQNKDTWDEMALDYIPEQSKTIDFLSQWCASKKFYLHAYSQTGCPTLMIDQDQKNVLEILAKKSLKKFYKYFSNKGGYEALHLTEEEEINPYLDGFFKQHIKRWNATQTPSLFLNESNKEFYNNLLSCLCPRKQVLFSVLKSQGSPIAFHFGFVNDRTLLYYKPSFETDVASYSPGKVLLKELLEYALAHGYQEFDFSLGQEAYKMDFANRMKKNCSFKIVKTPLDYWMSQGVALVRRITA